MQVDEITEDRLRRLAGLVVEDAQVLSLYLDLNPAEFGTQPARASAIRSLVNQARDELRGRDDLSHDEATALREDLDRVDAFLTDDFSADGAHGLAIFASGPAELFEVVRLPRPPRTAVLIDTSPFVEPLAELGVSSRWAVMLVSRNRGRILRGSPERLTEIVSFSDDVHGQHQQGGWSQARYQRSVDREAGQHVAAVCDELLKVHQRRGFDHLLIASAEEMWREVETHLDQGLRDRLAGRFDCEIEYTSPDDVLQAARPAMEAAEQAHRVELVGRLEAGLGQGQGAAAGLADVLDALVQRRVEALLYEPGFSAAGVVCGHCGWMGVEGDTCPLDGESLEQRDSILESAIEAAVLQDAEAVTFGEEQDPAAEDEPSQGTPLATHGGIAAVLRF